MRHVKTSLAGLLVVLLAHSLALAVDPAEQLPDPKLEARARHISAGLRCLVCQNQSIDDSDAALAKDLRIIVRQQLQQGKSDKEVVDYVVERYGEFVLLNPRLSGKTLLLWGAPLLILLGGVALAARLWLKAPKATPAAAPLSDEEQKALAALLEKEERTG